MLYRLFAAAIVVFWVCMMALLVENEIFPNSSRMREVPLSHVMKLLFMHEQPSDLNIYNGQTLVGSIRVQPRRDQATSIRTLDVTGDLRVQLTPEQKSRFSWIGLLEFTPGTNEVRRSEWKLSMIEPAHVRLEVETIPDSRTARYSIRNGEVLLAKGELPMQEGGLTNLSSLVAKAGWGTDLKPFLPKTGQQKPVSVNARRSWLKYHGERTETFLLTIQQDDQTLLEAHVSQLGQVLLAKTLIGYTFRLDSLAP